MQAAIEGYLDAGAGDGGASANRAANEKKIGDIWEQFKGELEVPCHDIADDIRRV